MKIEIEIEAIIGKYQEIETTMQLRHPPREVGENWASHMIEIETKHGCVVVSRDDLMQALKRFEDL